MRRPAPRGRRRTPADHVLLAADVDAPLDAWLEGLRAAAAGILLDAVLGHCAFYPGTREAAAFARWIAANRVEVGFSVIGSPGDGGRHPRRARPARGGRRVRGAHPGAQPTALRTAWRTWRAA